MLVFCELLIAESVKILFVGDQQIISAGNNRKSEEVR